MHLYISILIYEIWYKSPQVLTTEYEITIDNYTNTILYTATVDILTIQNFVIQYSFLSGISY